MPKRNASEMRFKTRFLHRKMYRIPVFYVKFVKNNNYIFYIFTVYNVHYTKTKTHNFIEK